MAMRITPQTQIGELVRQTGRHSANIARLQQQISSGLRVNRPSDDPLGTKIILTRKELLSRYEAEQRTLNVAKDRLNQSNSELLSIENLLVNAKNTASQGRSPLSDAERESFAQEIDSILGQIRDSANVQFDGDYLFSGDAVRTAPYPPGSAQAAYAGSAMRQVLSTSGRSALSVLYSGDEVFHHIDRGATVYIGNTGAQPGAGTDSAIGQADLVVTHTLTSFAAGSGIAAGTSSAAGDTILGPAGTNVLTINDTSGTGASGTISLNGGQPVAFTSSDTDLTVTGPSGEVIHVNTTAITAGFNGNLDVAADGELSVNGGPAVAINFSTTQAVADPSGRTTFVDSTAIRMTGTERLEYTGSSDIFQSLTALRDDLRNTRGLGEVEIQAALTRRMDDIDRHHENILNVVGDQSQTLKTIDDLTVRLDDLTLEAKQRISDVSSTDVAATAVELQEAQNLLQFSYAVTAQVFQTSLLDYIA
jgi:flagellar hook-associated protein 3 FlgL